MSVYSQVVSVEGYPDIRAELVISFILKTESNHSGIVVLEAKLQAIDKKIEQMGIILSSLDSKEEININIDNTEVKIDEFIANKKMEVQRYMSGLKSQIFAYFEAKKSIIKSLEDKGFSLKSD